MYNYEIRIVIPNPSNAITATGATNQKRYEIMPAAIVSVRLIKPNKITIVRKINPMIRDIRPIMI